MSFSKAAWKHILISIWYKFCKKKRKRNEKKMCHLTINYNKTFLKSKRKSIKLAIMFCEISKYSLTCFFFGCWWLNFLMNFVFRCFLWLSECGFTLPGKNVCRKIWRYITLRRMLLATICKRPHLKIPHGCLTILKMFEYMSSHKNHQIDKVNCLRILVTIFKPFDIFKWDLLSSSSGL